MKPGCEVGRFPERRYEVINVRNRKGFTLIELMVVMFILGLLAALVAPRMLGRMGESKAKAAKAQVELFGAALDTFHLDVGRYPTTQEGLQALRSQPTSVETWKGPYIPKEVPADPWGHPYQYLSPGTHGDYDLFSLGADNVEGGDGENQDVVSWK